MTDRLTLNEGGLFDSADREVDPGQLELALTKTFVSQKQHEADRLGEIIGADYMLILSDKVTLHSSNLASGMKNHSHDVRVTTYTVNYYRIKDS